MGFAREGNRLSAEKGREIKLISSFELRGYVYEVADNNGKWLVTEGSSTLDRAKNSDRMDVQKVTEKQRVKEELRHLDYKRTTRRLRNRGKIPPN